MGLPFGLHWVAASGQDVTGSVARHLRKQGIHVLKAMATNYFTKLLAMLHHLCLTEAEHKASHPPSQDTVWLGLQFNTIAMTITIPEAKLTEICNILAAWRKKEVANIYELCTPIGKLFFMAQCCPPPDSL